MIEVQILKTKTEALPFDVSIEGLSSGSSNFSAVSYEFSSNGDYIYFKGIDGLKTASISLRYDFLRLFE